MSDFINIYERRKPDHKSFPNLISASNQASKLKGELGVIFYEPGRTKFIPGYFGVVFFQECGQFIYPLTHWIDDGTTDFLDKNGKIIAIRFDRTGIICDLREKEYKATSPCLYCGTFNREHNLYKHIDLFLGKQI